MTDFPPRRPPVGPAAGDVSPLVELAPLIRCGAGNSATFEVFVTHRGVEAAGLRITVLGLDGRWVPPPLPVGPIEPGETTRITLSLVPERGTLGAQYPFVVAAEASPVSGRSGPVMGVAESILAVDGRDPITMTVSPQTPVAAFSQRIKVQVTNPGHVDRELSLSGSAARGAALSLSSSVIVVPAGRTVTVPGRVRVTHPRLFGHQNTHTFAVAARGQGAPEFAEGTLRSKPLIGGRVSGLLIAALVIALWAGAAVVGIPKLSNYFAGKNDTTSTAAPSSEAPASGAVGSGAAASGAAPSGAGSSGAGPSGAGSSGGGSSGGGSSGTGGSGTGGAGAGGAAASSGAAGQLSGTITGITPKGVQITLEPTSLVEAAAAGAAPAAGVTDPSTATSLRSISTALGKIPADAVRVAPTATDNGIRSTISAADGNFSFSDISSPGYYLLTMAKPGFATQRFMINSATLAAATPLKVALVAGDGSMSGKVTSSAVGGKVGAASVTITDGTVALQTSSSSKTGTWTVKGLSTPGTYLVTVSSTGYGASSKLVTLAAGGTGTADLSLTPGVAAIAGTVNGVDELGHLGGIGGVTVTATGTSKGVKASRTATTVTSGPVGTFSLPDLPVPGDYTVTVSGTGFASQTQQVSLAQGSSLARVNISLTRADGTVSGTVSGDKNAGGLIGAGLTLTGSAASYKTMTTSVPAGAYRFTGVPPGTYVLQASQYGRIPSSATVVVTAAGTATSNLTLVGAPDTELPNTASIIGRVVDSRTQGALSCDRAADPAVDCKVTATVSIPVPGTKTGATQTISDTVSPAVNYVLPRDKTKVQGLLAGLYAVTVSAPGYEPVTVQVQVAQGKINPAPQISLPPLGLVTGTITTHAGTTATPSCVISVPTGVAVPTKCTPTSTTACSVPASPSARCALTAANGNYEIRGLLHGGYQLVVLPTDGEYLPTTPLAVQLDVSDDFRFDTALDRLGRATVTVLDPNLSSLALGAAKGAIVGMVDARGIGRGAPLAGDSTADDGILTITNLLGSYTATASGDIPTGLARGTTVLPGTASVATGSIGLNQTVAITEVLTAPIGAIVGHVTVSVDGEVRDVPNTPVQISGVVAFAGRTPLSGAVTVSTDANGCYAIVPVGWRSQYPLTSSDCPVAVTGKSASVMKNTDGSPASLVALPIGVSVAAHDDPVTHNPSSQSYSATGVLIDFTGEVSVIPPISLLAQPSDFPDLSLDLKAPAGIPTDASNTSIVVTRKPAGAGNITVKADADGTLSFSDSLLVAGKAVPGLYTLSATKLGYSTAGASAANGAGMASGYATLWCDLGRACRFGTRTTAAAAWTMSQLPTISGTIVAPSLPPGVALTDADVTVNAAPSAAGSISVKVAADGTVLFRDASLLGVQPSGLTGGLAQPTAAGAPYRFTLTLPGYSPKQIAITCGTTFVVGCTSFSATLTPLPRFTGSITLVPSITTSPGQNLAGVKVSFTAQPNASRPVILSVADTTGTTSALSWNDPTQPQSVVTPGDYSLTFSKDGYTSAVVPNFSCPSPPVNSTVVTTCALGQITLNMYPKGTGDVRVDQLTSAGTAVDWADATVTLDDAPPQAAGLKITVEADTAVAPAVADPQLGHLVWTYTPVLTYPGLTWPGPYTITVTVPGYGTSAPISFDCTTGTTCGPTSVITLTRLATFAGTVTPKSTLDPAVTDYSDISAPVLSQPAGTGTITTTVSTTDGTISWHEDGLPVGIVTPGTYSLLVSKTGYQPVPVNLTCTTTSCPAVDVDLLMFPKGTGTVSVPPLLPGYAPIDWTRASVTLVTQPAGSSGLTLGLDPVDDTSAKLTWSDSNLPTSLLGITAPATSTSPYTIKVTLPGYKDFTSKPFTCSPGSTTCQPDPAIELVPLPGISGAVVVSPTANAPAAVDQTVSNISVSVDQQPNPANGVSVSVVADTSPAGTTGSISWSDPTQEPGRVTAGRYLLTFSKAGYVSAQADFTCVLNTPCVMDTVTLLMDPIGSGTLTVNTLTDDTTPIDWTTAAVTVVSKPVASAGLTVTVQKVGAKTAKFVWSDPSTSYATLTQPTTATTLYQIQVALPGYDLVASSAAPFACAPGAATCGPDLTFTMHPKFSGTVELQPTATTLSGAVITVTPPAGVNTVTAVASSTPITKTGDPNIGKFAVSWQETGAPPNLVTPGRYQVTLDAPGYQSTSTVWDCEIASCPALPLVLRKVSTLQVYVLSTATGNPKVNAGLYSLTGTQGGSVVTTATVNAPADQNVAAFPSLSSQADYSVNVHAAGFANNTFDKTSTAVTCIDAAGVSHTGLRVWPGGNTVCTVKLSPLGTIKAHTVGLSAGTTSDLPSTTVTVVKLVDGDPSGPSFDGSTGITGLVSITGNTTDDGLTDGTWKVTASQPGYADKVGTVDIDATTHAMKNPTGGLTLVGGVLQVPLTVQSVELQVHLTLNDVESLPAVKVTLAGPATLNCTITRTSAAGVTPATYACSETTSTGTVSNGSTVKYVDFPSVAPGVYTVTVSSPTSAYRTYSQQTQIAAGTPVQYIYIPLDQRASTQSGKVLLGNTPNTGITVTMRAAQDIGVVQNDLSGNSLSVNPNGDGTYTFTNVPDGQYLVVAEYPGYAYATYPFTVTEDSSLNKSPTPLSSFSLTTRASRSVDVTVTSAAAGAGVDLSGAKVTLTRTGAAVTGFSDAQQVLTLPAAAPFTVNVPQMPTGTWTAQITGQNNAPYQGTLTGQTVVVPQAAVSAMPPPVVAAPLVVQQALTTLTVTWDNDILDPTTVTCLAAPATAPATLSLTLTNTTANTTRTVAAQVVVGTSTTTATAVVYLPQGSYSFAPTVDSTMWSATPKTFTVADPSAGNATSSPAAPTVALVPVKVPVAVSMLVDGAGAGASGLSVTATKGATSTSTALDSGGLGSICLAPGSGWVFSVSSTTADVSVPTQSAAVQAAPVASDPAKDNAVAFTAFTVTPTVSLAEVTGRTGTAATDVVVTITRDGTQVYSETAPGVAPSTPATSDPVILGACATCVYKIAGAPAAGPFGASTPVTFTPSAALSQPVTLPYIAAMVTVTVTHGAPAVATSGAKVSVNVAGITAPDTGVTGKTLVQDVPVSTTAVKFTATWTDTAPTTPQDYSGNFSKVLTAGANTVTVQMAPIP